MVTWYNKCTMDKEEILREIAELRQRTVGIDWAQLNGGQKNRQYDPQWHATPTFCPEKVKEERLRQKSGALVKYWAVDSDDDALHILLDISGEEMNQEKTQEYSQKMLEFRKRESSGEELYILVHT